ncbi:MAG: DUF1573 domain-containing protein [Bacteroidota bacterium]
MKLSLIYLLPMLIILGCRPTVDPTKGSDAYLAETVGSLRDTNTAAKEPELADFRLDTIRNSPAHHMDTLDGSSSAVSEPKVVVRSTTSSPPKPSGRVKFDSLIHRLPPMTEGDVIEHRFRFQNVGAKDIEILEADVSCGCTTPSIPFLAIPPDGEGYIGVTYNSVNKSGTQEPEIKLKTSGMPKYVTLKMLIEVHDRLDEVIDSTAQTESLDTLSN